MDTAHDVRRLAAWFAGPKAENGEWFADTIRRIVQDYHSWRRNYFPEDGVVVDSALRRANEPFQDAFEDRLIELLARLKGDFPFQSPRYAAHMLAEQTLPSIAGYFAAMLYNPNNVTSEVASVTVRLEVEASQLIARMLGYTSGSWAHLTSGGTVANLEALWVARTVRMLPLVVREMRHTLSLPPGSGATDTRSLLRWSPDDAMASFARVFEDAERSQGATRDTTRRVIRAYLDSRYNVVERGLDAIGDEIRSRPALLLPESHHYCFEKAMDVLGMGRRALVPVRVDSDFRMRMEDLDEKLDALDREGRYVLGVVAVVGTTEEGAIDPVHEILNLRARRAREGKGSFWLHADAAYGGYLRTMTTPHRLGLGDATSNVKVRGVKHSLRLSLPDSDACDALERLGECDSITIDPHKLGYIPYPAGAVCFKSNLVKPITRQEAPYLDEAAEDVEAERRSEGIGLYILEGSKPGAAAAAVWLSHTLIPLDTSGHGILMRETLRNAAELHSLLEHYPKLTGDSLPVRAVCLCAPGSNIVCYAFRPSIKGEAEAAMRGEPPAQVSLARLNALNRAIYDRFTMTSGERVYEQRFFVSRTTIRREQYSLSTVGRLLMRLGVTPAEFEREGSEGVFLLRSVLMNPWYAEAKHRGRHFLSELVEELHRIAAEELQRPMV